MSRKTFLLALTGALFSFTSFNTTSYAMIQKCLSSYVSWENQIIDHVGYSPDSHNMYFNVQGLQTNFFVNVNPASVNNAFIQPMENTAYTSSIPVSFCTSKDSDNIFWVHQITFDPLPNS